MTILSILLSLVATITPQSNDTIFAADYGIIPDTYQNQTPKMQQLIKEASKRSNSVISFRAGRYDFWPEGAMKKSIFVSNTTSEVEEPDKTKTFGIYFGNVKNIIVDGKNATFMMHGDMTTVGFDNSQNIELKNLTIDFERPGGSEMTYIHAEPGRVRVRMHRDTRYAIVNNRLQLIGEGWRSMHIHCIKYNPFTREMRYSNDWNLLANSDVRELEPGILEFTVKKDFKPIIGETLTLRDIIRRNVGMLNYHSKGTTLRDVNIRYMHVLGIVSHFSRDITMERVNCCPSETSGRILASSADFMHFSGCSGHIEIKDCNYSGAHDDAINVHGTNLRLIKRLGKNIALLKFMHHQTYGFIPFQKGDTIAFVGTRTMLRSGYTTVSKLRQLNDREFEVTFTNSIPSDIEDNQACVENISATPTVHISGCNIGRLSTRGILMTTPRKAIIENNIFHDLGMAAILIEADADAWYESGPVCDVTIRNNKFINCNYTGVNYGATISINPSNTEGSEEHPVHEGILIEGNTFDNANRPLLWAKSAGNIIFKDNQSLQLKNQILTRWTKEIKLSNNNIHNLTITQPK